MKGPNSSSQGDLDLLQAGDAENNGPVPNNNLYEGNGQGAVEANDNDDGLIDTDDDDDEYDDDDDTDDSDSKSGENLSDTVNPDHFFACMRHLKRNNEIPDLPRTVSVLEGANREKLYLIGTAHFSKESCEDVRKVITKVQPDTVVVELCSARTQILTMDEEELAKMTSEGAFTQLRNCIKLKGLLSGLVLFNMLYMTAHVTKQLGMAPGSEFRTAFQEAKKIPGCGLCLGDRPVSITLQRMLGSLSLWQKIRFAFSLLRELKPISAEDIEKLKEQDVFEQLMEELTINFPQISQVVVKERDLFITGYLQNVLKSPVFIREEESVPRVVVGVFGMGHCNGIKAHFHSEVTLEQMKEIQRLPPPSKHLRIVKLTLRGVVLFATIFSAYKLAQWYGVSPTLPRLLS